MAASRSSRDPFAPENREAHLTVVGNGNFPLPGSGYSVLLNKFRTMPDHVLLVTEKFELQGAAPLTAPDLAAFYALVTDLPGAGFYNSGEAAGASQPHKHFQALPLDILATYGAFRSLHYAVKTSESLRNTRSSTSSDKYGTGNFDSGGTDDEGNNQGLPFSPPVDRLLSRYAEVSFGATVGVARVLPELPFRHAFAPLDRSLRWAADGGERLRRAYHSLLDVAGVAAPPTAPSPAPSPYNLLLTAEWMLVVPRSQRKYGSIDVNGMGFLGCLLVRDEEGRSTLQAATPSTVLSAVGLPKSPGY